MALVAQPLQPATNGNAGAIISVASGRVRKSNLHAEVMLLAGHAGPIFTMKFNPTGQAIASGGHENDIFLWQVYGETPQNYALLKGHRKDVMEVSWNADGNKLYSASADRTLVYWDAVTCTKVKKMVDHEAIVNSCASVRSGPEMLVSGSDDRTAKLWDLRMRAAAASMQHDYQVTAVCFSHQSDQVITAGIDNLIRVWDLRKLEPVIVLAGHMDTVTGLALSPDGSFVLSNSKDMTLRAWDVRPFCVGDRCQRMFTGHQHDPSRSLLRCAWSADGKEVAAGSSDRFVYVWDTLSRQIKYKLPGHQGTVTEVAFHPKEPIIASCSLDKQIFLGEIE